MYFLYPEEAFEEKVKLKKLKTRCTPVCQMHVKLKIYMIDLS